MDFELPGDDDPRRVAVRAWLDGHPDPTGRQLAEAGYVAPHWPAPWGLDADPIHQILIDEELRRAKVRRLANPLVCRVATRLDVVFEDLLREAPDLALEHDQPALAGGWFRMIRLRRI